MSVENLNQQINLVDAEKNTKEALKNKDIDSALSGRIDFLNAYLDQKESEYQEEVYLTEQCMNFSEEKTQMFCGFLDKHLPQVA